MCAAEAYVERIPLVKWWEANIIPDIDTIFDKIFICGELKGTESRVWFSLK